MDICCMVPRRRFELAPLSRRGSEGKCCLARRMEGNIDKVYFIYIYYLKYSLSMEGKEEMLLNQPFCLEGVWMKICSLNLVIFYLN